MKMKAIILVVLAISSIESKSIGESGCRISIIYKKGDLAEPQPLILSDTEKPTFLLPNAQRILSIPTNTSILLACPGKNNELENFIGKKFVTALCLSDTQFLVDSKLAEFNTFKCKVLPKEAVIKTNQTCLGTHQRYDIGFSVRKYFIPLIEICRDEITLRTYYSRFMIAKEIIGYQSKFPRPYWKYGSFYPGHNMNAVYKAKSQLNSLTILLGSEEQAQKFIKPGEQQYLNRGHLAAKADFVYGAQQTATFWLLNTAPQWATFNAGNWMIVERDVRDFASMKNTDLMVYTGVHGVTTLTDINGNEQPLYLNVNETHRTIPVPRFYWKIIHDPISNRATAFVGLNEPYAKNITEDMYLCTDIGNDPAFSWLSWEPKNILRGVSYVCSVEDLRKSVPTIPQLGEIGVLV